MAYKVAERQATYGDYLKTPEGAAYQLINGELIMAPAPGLRHHDIAATIVEALRRFVKKRGLGRVFNAPVDVYFSQRETYQPDIFFVSKEKLHLVGRDKVKGPPDLIIEILSPKTARYDLSEKKHVYESYGVKEYWIVDPNEKTIEVFEYSFKGFVSIAKAEGKGRIGSQVLDGFSVRVEKIFEGV